MSHADFVHLRTHSAYSLSEGAIKIKDLIKLAKEDRMPALGIADTSNLFGALDFSLAALDNGIQPIIGVQLHVRREDEKERGFTGTKESLRRPEPDQLVLLAQNRVGYGNLMKLTSKAYLETEGGETPQVPLDVVAMHSDGLIALTGGVKGAVARLFLEGRKDAAMTMMQRLMAAFPGRLYVELQRHGQEEEERAEPDLIECAYALGVPLIATNEPFFSRQSMYEAHDALLCIADGAYVSQDDRRRLTPEHYFKSAAEMRALFADLPEAIDNTLVVAKRTAFTVEKLKPLLPSFHVEGLTEADVLANKSREGLQRRLEKHVFTAEMAEAEREAAAKPYRERLDYELDVIKQMGFPGYFLIVSDFIQWAKTHDVPVGPGRGSGAGSVVAWALTITDLDPLRWGLLFERFLNPERISMPDFDIDFCQDRRELVIRYVQEKYGYDRVAQIITFGKLQARAVLRDVGRVLQMPYSQVDRISKLIPNNPADPVTLKQALEQEPMLQEMRDTDERVAHLLDMGMKLEGLYRHASTHAAGVVIGDRPLDELAPLYRDPRSDMPVTGFNMKWVESTGLVKFDFLGLKTLSVIQKTIEWIKVSTGKTLDITTIPLNDQETFARLGRGETVGVFQLESAGMRDVLRNMRADCFEDIIAVVALYRPGPMDNIPHYISVKLGKEKADYLHPRLEWILKETNGIMIYQEQVMQIAQELSGYTLGGADLLRRAMGKKIKEEMDAQRRIFVDGAVERGVDQSKANEIFDQVNKFAGYGFNKSHAAAYALVAYQTAWLKTHYPAEFIAASMTYDMHSTDKLSIFRQELDRLGIKMLAPDVNHSGPDFWVERQTDGALAIRYALAALKNVGQSAMETMVSERNKNGKFKDLGDFAHRIDYHAVNRRQLENLIRSGAFDCLERNRARMLDGIETILREAQSSAQDRDSGQSSLFGDDASSRSILVLNDRADFPPMERLQAEFDAVGFYLSAHPMDAYSTSLKRLGVVKITEIAGHLKAGGAGRVKLAGMVNSKREGISSRGSRYAFIAFSDATGMAEAVVFAETLSVVRDLLEPNKALLFTVDARMEGDQLKLTTQHIEALDKAAARTSAGLRIFIQDAKPVLPIRDLLARESGGRGKIRIVIRADGREVETCLAQSYALRPSVMATLQSIPGILDVQEI